MDSRGFAHGFLTLSETAEFLYKTTDYYSPKDERSLIWDDIDIGIRWPKLEVLPILSSKDLGAMNLSEYCRADHL